ncbi:MAG: SOS response-associated peptidase family protein, partial [Allomuricauda sp.]
MCYHISQRQERLEKIMDSFDVEAEFENELLPVYHHLNGFDHGQVMIITQEDPELLQLGTWGLVPPSEELDIPVGEQDYQDSFLPYEGDFNSYWKKVGGGSLNTKDLKFFVPEGKKERHPNWKNRAILNNKCLIIVDGLYEPHHLEDSKIRPIPHYFEQENSEPFALWGIYTHHDGVYTCSVLTTKANEHFERIHNKAKRMPFCIDPMDKGYYLNKLNSEHDIRVEFIEFNSIELKDIPVSRDVTNSHVKSNRED